MYQRYTLYDEGVSWFSRPAALLRADVPGIRKPHETKAPIWSSIRLWMTRRLALNRQLTIDARQTHCIGTGRPS